MDLLERLMLAKEISFQDGEIRLLKQRMVFYPSYFVALYIQEINHIPSLISQLYASVKAHMFEEGSGFASNVGKEYKFDLKNYADWFVNLAKLAGWGKISWTELDEQNKYGVIDVENSPVGTYLKGKVDSPCDHVSRGFFGGGGTSAFSKDVDSIEIECIALGGQRCRFIIDSIDRLREKFPEQVRQQIG